MRRPGRRPSRRSSIGLRRRSDTDPLQGVANLFDVGVVFALGFLLALMAYMGLPHLEQLEAVRLPPEQSQRLDRYRVSEETSGGNGVRLGVAYRLKNGEVICVPE